MKKYNHQKTRVPLTLLTLLLLALFAVIGSARAGDLDLTNLGIPQTDGEAKVSPEVKSELAALPTDEMITVIVTLRNQADLSHITASERKNRLNQVIMILKNQANATQNHLQALLKTRQDEGLVANYETYWIFNGLAVTATAEVIRELANRPEVAFISPNKIDIEPTAQLSGSPSEPNLSLVNAPELWNLGYQGQGIIVANMDTGVYKDHPDLINRWRGGNNSWFDPYGEHPNTPTDTNGHGTWTMGVMVGGDAGGTSIGMAPSAQWIAVKIFDDSGQSTAAAIHSGYQWLLDPDGDPGTADAPNVVNNSWTFGVAGCNLEFQQDILSLRAAGILPIFAAGNAGPSSNTSLSPANNPGAFPVGATDNNDFIYYESSRGPSSCNTGDVYPELVAPGVAIRTSDNSGFYYNPSGTSMAAPHVAGALALLLSSNPSLTANEQEAGLINGAIDLGAAGPDDDLGYGRLDVLAAYQWLLSNPSPTPTPTPIPTTNLAQGRAVTVSSSQDDSHNGDMAVDGNTTTYWQTKKAVGKHVSSDEWIEVDLGTAAIVNQVILLWDINFATSYIIELSPDGNNWTTIFSTTNGNGGTDNISFGDTQAQYARMVSISWKDSSFRNSLLEFEIYGTAGTPPPTNTPTPTPTSTPVNPGTMHLGGLSGSSRKIGRDWKGTVSVIVHKSDESPLSDVTVTGTWSAGYNGTDSCVTDVSGSCSLSTGRIDGQQASVTFTVGQVSFVSYSYQESDNHDPAGSSISINNP